MLSLDLSTTLFPGRLHNKTGIRKQSLNDLGIGFGGFILFYFCKGCVRD